MGVRPGVVVCATSFLLGCFFTHWIADSITLWQSPLTDDRLYTSAAYYSAIAVMPRWMESILVALGTAAAIALFLSFYDGEAGNLMFDGGSLFLSMCALVVWVYSVLPNIDILAERASTTSDPSAPFPSDLKTSILEIATKNLVCSVALTGVILLQAGRLASEQKQDQEDSIPSEMMGTASGNVTDTEGEGEASAGLITSAAEESALADDHEPVLELAPREMFSRGRRRSHHDHLETELTLSSSESGVESRSSNSPRRRDGSKRRSVVGSGSARRSSRILESLERA